MNKEDIYNYLNNKNIKYDKIKKTYYNNIYMLYHNSYNYP